MSPIFVQNGKILITGNALRGCCCAGGKWRINISSKLYECVDDEKGEPLDEDIIFYPFDLSSYCPASVRAVGGQGLISAGITTIESVEYYELLSFPRDVVINDWTNTFPDGLNSEYPNPCDSGTFLLMDFIPNIAAIDCLESKSTTEDGITRTISVTKTYDQNGNEVTQEFAKYAILEFVSVATGNDGSIGPDAEVDGKENGISVNCRDINGIPARFEVRKKTRYDVTISQDEAGLLTCCLSNPLEADISVPFDETQGSAGWWNDLLLYKELGEPPKVKYSECLVFNTTGDCCPQSNGKPTYIEIYANLQIQCVNSEEWLNVENPEGLTAPSSKENPGTGDPGTAVEDDPSTPEDETATSTWKITECVTCSNPPCPFYCTGEGVPAAEAVDSGLDEPTFLEVEECQPQE